jgi:hypothetical protein
VNSPYFCSHNLYQYRLPSHRYAEFLTYAQPVPYRTWHGRTWYSGPSYHEVARVSAVPPVRTSMTTFGVPSSSHGSAFVHGGNAAPPPAHVNGGGSYGYVAPVPTRSQMPLTNGFVSPGARENRGQPQGGVIAPAGASHGRMEPQPYAQPSYRSAPPPAPVQHYAPPAQHFSPPPAQHFSPPAQHFSAPAPRMSSPAPSHSFSGGGFSHGGGGRLICKWHLEGKERPRIAKLLPRRRFPDILSNHKAIGIVTTVSPLPLQEIHQLLFCRLLDLIPPRSLKAVILEPYHLPRAIHSSRL